MKQGKVFISLIVGFILIGGIVVFQATRTTSSDIITPSALLDSNHEKLRIRVAGRVSEDPITYSLEPNIFLSFKIHDPKGDTGKTIPVEYEQLKPDMFASGRDVLIDGDYKNGVLYARTLLTQCPSKYEPPKPGDINYKMPEVK